MCPYCYLKVFIVIIIYLFLTRIPQALKHFFSLLALTDMLISFPKLCKHDTHFGSISKRMQETGCQLEKHNWGREERCSCLLAAKILPLSSRAKIEVNRSITSLCEMVQTS